MKTYFHAKACIWMCIAAFFIIAQMWKQLNHSQTNKWINKCSMWIQWHTIRPWKVMKYWYVLQYGWTLKILFCVKDNNPKKSHIVWFHIYETSRKGQSIGTKIHLLVVWRGAVRINCLLGSLFGVIKLFKKLNSSNNWLIL